MKAIINRSDEYKDGYMDALMGVLDELVWMPESPEIYKLKQKIRDILLKGE